MNWLTALLAIAVCAIRFGQGLDNPSHEKIPLKPWLVTKAVLAVILLAPLFFLTLILVFKPALPITCALIIMAGSPAANLSNRSIQAFGGDVAFMNRIELIVCLLSSVTTPILLELMELLLGINLNVRFSIIIGQLIATQFLPTIFGTLLRKHYPTLSHYAKFIMSGASWLLILIFALLIIQHFPSFSQPRIHGYIAVIIATLGAFLLGVILGGKNPKQQISLSIETALRNPGLAYLIASENFIEVNANIILIPYTVTVLVTIFLSVSLFKIIRKPV
jgi:bile acid:Na+ symporter, BASS family